MRVTQSSPAFPTFFYMIVGHGDCFATPSLEGYIYATLIESGEQRTPQDLRFLFTDEKRDCSEEGLAFNAGANSSLKPSSSPGRMLVSQHAMRR